MVDVIAACNNSLKAVSAPKDETFPNATSFLKAFGIILEKIDS